MLCEKCGKKVTGKSSVCDSCGYPIKMADAGKFPINIVATSGKSFSPESPIPQPSVFQPVVVKSGGVSKGLFAGILAGAVTLSLVAGWFANSFFNGGNLGSQKEEGTEVSALLDVENPDDAEETLGIMHAVEERNGECVIVNSGYCLFMSVDDSADVKIGVLFENESGKVEEILKPTSVSEFDFIFDMHDEHNSQADSEITDEDGAFPEIIRDKAKVSDRESDSGSGSAVVDIHDEYGFEKIFSLLKSNTIYMGEGKFAFFEGGIPKEEDDWFFKGTNRVYIIPGDGEKVQCYFPLSTNSRWISRYKDGYMLGYDEKSKQASSIDDKNMSKGSVDCKERPNLSEQRKGNILIVDGKEFDIETMEEK